MEVNNTSGTNLSQLFGHRRSMSFDSDHWQESMYDGFQVENDKVDDEIEKADGEDEKMDEDEKEDVADEKEDVDEEADKRYWEAKSKEGDHRVWLMISENKR